MCLLLYLKLNNRSEEITKKDKTKNEQLLTQNSVSFSG